MIHPLDDVRGLQEEQREKARWTLIVREQIARTLLGTGYFFADDLHALGIPEQHSAVIGSQTASFAAKKLMVAFTRRKVEHAAANGRKANVYRITKKGRQELSKLVGVSAGCPARESLQDGCSPCADPGESSTGGRGQAGGTAQERPPEGRPADATPGAAPPETLSLLPKPDPEAWAA